MRIPRRYRKHFQHPYTKAAREHRGFRKWLLKKGLLSPHFPLAEAHSHDGVRVPPHLIPNAQKHAFNLEQLRHRLGDKPLYVLSWYRSPSHNAAVGGVPNSQHLTALATDIDRQLVEQRPGFDAHADFVFANGGFGQYPAGSRHVDSRGYRARWTSS